MGVLQRIAVSYVIASIMCKSFGRKTIAALATTMLLGYWLLIVQVSAGDPFSKVSVFSQGIDLISFRSCIASAVPIMIGYLVGSYIDRPKYDLTAILTLVGIGVAITLVGKLWSLEFPIIKSLLWSSSYVVFTVGVSIIAFSVCLWIIEKENVKSWTTPFVHIGLNPLFIYALSITLDKLTWMIEVTHSDTSLPLHEWIHETLFRSWAGDINGSLLYAVCFVVIHWLIAYGLFKKRIFIKV
jgi:predicted acyltransferase